jgi:hypothetical protein
MCDKDGVMSCLSATRPESEANTSTASNFPETNFEEIIFMRERCIVKIEKYRCALDWIEVGSRGIKELATMAAHG